MFDIAVRATAVAVGAVAFLVFAALAGFVTNSSALFRLPKLACTSSPILAAPCDALQSLYPYFLTELAAVRTFLAVAVVTALEQLAAQTMPSSPVRVFAVELKLVKPAVVIVAVAACNFLLVFFDQKFVLFD